MKAPIIPFTVAALLAATSFAFGAPKTFEGKVTYELTTGRGPVEMAYYVKDHQARTEISTGNRHAPVMLMNFNTHRMTILIPGQKMYMVRPMHAPRPQGSSNASSMPAPSRMDFQRTGQFETILGHKCEKFVVRSHGNVTEVWAAEGMGVFMNPTMEGPMGRGSSPRNAWESELRKHGFFPLRVVTRDADGHPIARMEAKAIDTSPLPDSLFAPPGDYHKFEMPAMPGMGGMNPFKR